MSTFKTTGTITGAASGAAAGAALGPYGAAAGFVLGGIGGFLGASSGEKQAARTKRVTNKREKKARKAANKYAGELDKSDKENYYAMREYSHDTNIENWNRGKEIQDLEYAELYKQFEKSQRIGGEQIGLNKQAFKSGKDAERASISDMFLQQKFQRESSLSELRQVYITQNLNKREQNLSLQGIRNKQTLGIASIKNQIQQLATSSSLSKESTMVDGLIAEGQASLGQAGKSSAKQKQSSLAKLQRSLMAIDTEFSGKHKQAAIQLAELNADTSLAVSGVGLNLEKIDNAINDAEKEASYNKKIMDANMQSFLDQSQRNLEDLALQKKYANLNTRASMMLKPPKLSYTPKPTKPPERIFVDRMKVQRGAPPIVTPQNTFLPMIQSVGNAVTSVYDIAKGNPNWGN
jgi:hypothetical protein